MYQGLFTQLEAILSKYSLSDFDTPEFREFCDAKAKEIFKNYPAGRTYQQVYNSTKNGFLNEFILSTAICGTMNPLPFDAKNPDSFCYDIHHPKIGNIEVKSWDPTRSKWLNFNLNNSYRFDDPLLEGVGHFDSLCKYNDRVNLVITLYRDGNQLKVSSVISPRAFQLFNGKTYGQYVKESRVLPSGQKTSHYLDIRKVAYDGLGWFK